jgi:hypothetical protein
MFQSACKPGSVWRCDLAIALRDGHSSGMAFARHLKQPTRTTGLDEASRHSFPSARLSLFGLAPSGVCRANPVARTAVGSYPAFSPLPQTCRGGLFSVALSLGLPPAAVSRHRSSMEPGLSSPRSKNLSALRPSSDRPTDWKLP